MKELNMIDPEPPNSTNIYEIRDEGSSSKFLNIQVTGGKSVSEIVQLLRTVPNLTTAKLNIAQGNDDKDDLRSKANKAFPWMTKFTVMCKEIFPEPSIKKLDKLLSEFLTHLEHDVEGCYKKPNRAYQLRKLMNDILVFFHLIYWEIKKPLEHASYLDKMSKVMALYMEVELKSSRRGREHPKKISDRICASLFLLLDNSMDHILDSVLKSKFFIKKYSEICVPVMARLLKEGPGQMYEATYIRYLLSFKLWKKLAGKEHYASINKEAVTKLKTPPDFAEKLKSGAFTNVLPYVSKSEKDRITLFFMQSPFNLKKKAEIFLKDGRRMQPSVDLDQSFVFDEDFKVTNVFDGDSQENGSSMDLMNEIWSSLVEKESDPLDELFDMDHMEEEETIFIDLTKPTSKDKLKQNQKGKPTNSITKMSVKKHKTVKVKCSGNMKKSLNVGTADLMKSDKSKPLIIPVISKEEHSFKNCTKVEEGLKNDDKLNLQLPNSSETSKPQKPCATVEPEQCKEVEPDSQSKNIDVLKINQIQITNINSGEAVSRLMIENQAINNNEGSANPSILNAEPFAHNPSIVNESSVEVMPSEIADSSGICEEIKVEANSEEFFVVNQMYKDIKGDEQPLLEDQLVAEEVVIDSELTLEGGCTTYFVVDGNGQGNHHDILNVISKSKDPSTYSADTRIKSSDICKKSQERQGIQTEIVSLLGTQNNYTNQLKGCTAKDQSSVSPENHQFLSSIVASSVSLDRREDSDLYNDIMLTRLFSEVNPDEGSDDDNRYHSRSQYAGGGKIPAFREQMEESKSDGGEEFESPSPASPSDSQNSIVEGSQDITASESVPLETSSPDFDQEVKSHPLIPVKGKILSQSNAISQEKSVNYDSPQLQEVSVSLSYMPESFSEYLVGKEKMNPKGMCEPPDNILHFKTVDEDCKFYYLQQQLYTLYNTTQNILDTDPVPYPPTVIVSPPIGGYVRCPCAYCNSNFMNLDRNYKILFSMRSSRVCSEVDKKRLLSKMYLTIVDQTKMEDERLLKAIEETIPEQKDVPKENKEIQLTKPKKKEKPNTEKLVTENFEVMPKDVPTTQGNTKTLPKPDPSENQYEQKNEYSSLPPKKRKAFSLHSGLRTDVNTKLGHCEDSDIQVERESKKIKTDRANSSEDALNNISGDLNYLPANEECKKPKVTKECSVIIDKYSPVKIKAVDGRYCVLAENSSNVEKTEEADTPMNDTKLRHDMCKRKRSKEEKRLRKERKRLKKLMRANKANQ